MTAPPWTLRLALLFVLGGSALAFAQDKRPQPAPEPGQPVEIENAGAGVPKLDIGKTEWDFGSLWSGQEAHTQIRLQNLGSAPLTIKVSSTCGCTVGKVKPELQPGESDMLTLTYNTKKRARKVSQVITLKTNDPERKTARIKVRGEVKELFKIEPPLNNAFAFGRLLEHKRASRSVELVNKFGKPLSLRLKPLDDRRFSVVLEEIEPGLRFKLTVTTNPPLAPGVVAQKLQIDTGKAELPPITIGIRAIIEPRVSLSPTRLYVSRKLARSIERKVRLTYQADRPVQITQVKASCDKITAEVLPGRGGSRFGVHVIRVSLPPGGELPPGGATLEIYTDDPDYPKFEVQITTQRPAGRLLSSKNK